MLFELKPYVATKYKKEKTKGEKYEIYRYCS